MSDQYLIDDEVPSSFSIVIVAASYLASFCGCMLTIEILHRRGTALGNLRSWLETLACAVSMGLVGIWCMHFIGNRAIILGNGDPKIQLVYDSGFTVLSFFLPVIGLMVSFSAAEFPSRTPWLYWAALICTGVFAGLSAVGMHYVANFGVTNYKLLYTPRFVAASVTIAIGDCLTVLVLFYNLREKWISAGWKRILCAMALAGGVSAMHFTAATHCTYRLRSYNDEDQINSRNVQVIIAGAMCGASALLILACLLIARWRNRILKTKSQKVMLACAMFDRTGRVLVTTEGILPSWEITDKYNHKTFDEDFDTAHPVFQWIFRTTHNWIGVAGLVSQMKSHVSTPNDDTMMRDSQPGCPQSSILYDEETCNNFALLFKERFCTAAASIALSMHLPIEHLGVLYDQVVETGTLAVEETHSRRNARLEAHDVGVIEAGSHLRLFGKGQLMFITREVNEDDATKLLNSGFKFASVHYVGRNIARAMQISLPVLESHLSGLKRYNESLQTTEKPGTWLSLFAMIPKPHGKGFDVVVQRQHQDQLPDVPLLPTHPQAWQVSIFERLDGQRVHQILALLEDRTGRFMGDLSPRELHFLTTLRQAIITLIQPFPQEWLGDTRFWSRQLIAHYSHSLQCQSPITILYAFTVIGDMHASIDGSEAVARVPQTFFDARHRCYANSPDHAILASDTYREFAPLFAKKEVVSRRRHLHKPSVVLSPHPLHGLKQSKIDRIAHTRFGSIDDHGEDNSSIFELFSGPPRQTRDSSVDRSNRRTNYPSGILVNSETAVQLDSKPDLSDDDALKMNMPMGRNVAVETARPAVTFVDELVAITKERFSPASRNIFRLTS